jgi:hypothetical protein
MQGYISQEGPNLKRKPANWRVYELVEFTILFKLDHRH